MLKRPCSESDAIALLSEVDAAESGESRARCEQLEYLIDGVASARSGPATRRASARELAEALASPRGRFFARSRGLVPRLYSLLEIAAAPPAAAGAAAATAFDEALALPVAAIAFFLAQERSSLEVRAATATPCVPAAHASAEQTMEAHLPNTTNAPARETMPRTPTRAPLRKPALIVSCVGSPTTR